MHYRCTHIRAGLKGPEKTRSNEPHASHGQPRLASRLHLHLRHHQCPPALLGMGLAGPSRVGDNSDSTEAATHGHTVSGSVRVIDPVPGTPLACAFANVSLPTARAMILLCREIRADEEWRDNLGRFGAVRVVRQVCVGDGVWPWPTVVFGIVPDEVLARCAMPGRIQPGRATCSSIASRVR